MNAKILLRTAAGLILVHLAGHALGHSGWDHPEDPKMMEVVTVMKGYKGEFMGAMQSMADYYNGYSILIFGLFAMSIYLLWVTSQFVSQQPSIARKILVPLAAAYIFFGIVEFVYFFPFAAIMSFFAGVLMILAIGATKKTTIKS